VTPSFLYYGVSLPNADPAAAVVLPVRIVVAAGIDLSLTDLDLIFIFFVFEN
jgi:hypothetical protein